MLYITFCYFFKKHIFNLTNQIKLFFKLYIIVFKTKNIDFNLQCQKPKKQKNLKRNLKKRT